MNDIFEEVADYRDLEQRLFKYTDAWTRESGEFPLKMKSERENADAILSKHYYNVDDHHLDYDDIHVDGTNYKIIFSDPKEVDYDDIEESFESNVFKVLVEDTNESKYIEMGYTQEEAEAIDRLLKKYPTAYVPVIDDETNLPILPRSF